MKDKKRDKKKILLYIGLFSILSGVIIGIFAYNTSFDIIMDYMERTLQAKCHYLTSNIERSGVEFGVEETLSKIETDWRNFASLTEDEYLSIINRDSILLLDTRDTDTIGTNIGENKVLNQGAGNEKCLADLAESMNEFSGVYISSSGEHQIVAFSPIPGKGLIVGVHRSKKILYSEIRSRIKIFIYIFILLFFFILPLTFILFYRILTTTQKKGSDILKQLGSKESQITAFLENTITGCYIYQDNMFKFANTKFIKMVGFESIENMRDDFSISDIIESDTMISIKELLIEQLNGGADSFQKIVSITPKDGVERWMEIFSNIIEFEGKPASFGIIVDITKNKEYERELINYKNNLEESVKMRTGEYEEQVDKLSKSQRAMLFMIEDLNRTSAKLKDTQDELLLKERLAVLGQFSGSISHELRNPLSVIDSSAYYLRTALADKSAKVDEHLGRIKNAVIVSTSIIESLLNLTRMKKPVMEINDLIEILNQCITEVRIPDRIELVKGYHQKSIKIDCEFLQIKIAFKNILKNAVESMESAGRLEVKTSPIDKYKVKISIKDSGKGISEKNLPNIFKPLFTLKAKGIGFGLPLSKMIVENHNGEIYVNSELDAGTEFIVILQQNMGNNRSAGDT